MRKYIKIFVNLRFPYASYTYLEKNCYFIRNNGYAWVLWSYQPLPFRPTVEIFEWHFLKQGNREERFLPFSSVPFSYPMHEWKFALGTDNFAQFSSRTEPIHFNWKRKMCSIFCIIEAPKHLVFDSHFESFSAFFCLITYLVIWKTSKTGMKLCYKTNQKKRKYAYLRNLHPPSV